MNTWTCLCGNVNPESATSCLKCNQPHLSQDALEAIKCYNEARKVLSPNLNPLSEVDIAKSLNSDLVKYIIKFYELSRQPLLNQISKLEAQSKTLEESINTKNTIINLQKHIRLPETGDKVWTVRIYYDSANSPDTAEVCTGDNEPVQVTVEHVRSDGFYDNHFVLKRLFSDYGKSWWWSKP